MADRDDELFCGDDRDVDWYNSYGDFIYSMEDVDFEKDEGDEDEED